MPNRQLAASTARDLAAALLEAYGAGKEQAGVVASHLIEAEQSGLPSHGLIRVPQYIDEILAGEISPQSLPAVRQVGAGRIAIDASRCFGQVAGDLAVRHGSQLADADGFALVTVRQCAHAGRIGAYAEQLGVGGFLSLIFCSGPRSGHRVAPFNGREGRLATNPIAFSIPTSGWPIVGDFSTAAAPEGRIRTLRNLGRPAPEDTLLDALGQPTTDPGVLYSDPSGVILPLGGARLGHRGFALGLLVEALATLLTGDETADASRVGNNLAFAIIKVDAGYQSRADRMADYARSAAASGSARVLLPGDPERQQRSGANRITVEHTTWQAIAKRAARAGIALPAS
jgi:uncharacterized oxidoreductase